MWPATWLPTARVVTMPPDELEGRPGDYAETADRKPATTKRPVPPILAVAADMDFARDILRAPAIEVAR